MTIDKLTTRDTKSRRDTTLSRQRLCDPSDASSLLPRREEMREGISIAAPVYRELSRSKEQMWLATSLRIGQHDGPFPSRALLIFLNKATLLSSPLLRSSRYALISPLHSATLLSPLYIATSLSPALSKGPPRSPSPPLSPQGHFAILSSLSTGPLCSHLSTVPLLSPLLFALLSSLQMPLCSPLLSPKCHFVFISSTMPPFSLLLSLKGHHTLLSSLHGATLLYSPLSTMPHCFLLLSP